MNDSNINIRLCSETHCQNCDYYTLQYDEYGFSEPNTWHCAYRLQLEDDLGLADDKTPCRACIHCDYFNPEYYNKENNECSKYYGEDRWK